MTKKLIIFIKKKLAFMKNNKRRQKKILVYLILNTMMKIFSNLKFRILINLMQTKN